MEILIKQNGSGRYGQQCAVFKDESGLNSLNFSSMHFASIIHNENSRIENWHQLMIKKDFIDTLKMYGRLPISTATEQFKLFQENMELKKQVTQFQ